MKITLCGSVKFAKEIVGIYNQLKKSGHESQMHNCMFGIADGTAEELINEISENHGDAKRKHGFIKWWHDCIKNSDAILVCNFDKNGIKNYIGGNTLMEMGFAHVNDKKVFLLNPIPEEVSYTDEIKAMTDVVLKGDLKGIN
jgi:hypothetical protein